LEIWNFGTENGSKILEILERFEKQKKFEKKVPFYKVSTTSESQCADRNPQPEQREMTFKGP
jgi:hypothetical protein